MTRAYRSTSTEQIDTAELLSAITTTGARSVLLFHQFLSNEVMRPGAVKENPEWFLACGRLLADRVLGPNGGIMEDRGNDRALMNMIDDLLKQS